MLTTKTKKSFIEDLTIACAPRLNSSPPPLPHNLIGCMDLRKKAVAGLYKMCGESPPLPAHCHDLLVSLAQRGFDVGPVSLALGQRLMLTEL